MRFSDISIKSKMFIFVILVLFFNTITLVVMNVMDDTHKYDTVFMEISEQNKSLAQKVLDYSELSVSNDQQVREKTTNKVLHFIDKFENNLSKLIQGGFVKVNGQPHFIKPVSSTIQQKVNHLNLDVDSIKVLIEKNSSVTKLSDQQKENFLKKIWANDMSLHTQEMINIHFLENQSKDFNFKILLILFFVFNSFIVLVTFFLTNKYIISPIRKLSKDYKELLNGTEEKHILLNRKDEIGELSKSLDEVFTQLNQSKHIAEEAKKTQSMFLANMSHEIRTPMNSIVGFTNLLVKTPLNIKQGEFLSSIQINARNLLVIINDILDFSKAEANKIVLEQVVFSVEDIVNQIVTACQEKAQKNNTEIVFHYDKDLPSWVIGDPTRLYQITLNLVSNAVKFTNNGKVTISVFSESNERGFAQIRFAVRDTGIGIAKAEIPKLFESFTQASSSITRKFGGTGLGLSIVKHLVNLHGGEIEVESELGKGSVFYFSVSYPIAEEPQKLAQSMDEIPENLMIELKKYQFNILLVEDIIFNRTVAIETMQEWGLHLHILEAENGLEGVKKLENNDIDLVLMDIQMPEMDGYTATKKIREELTGIKSTVPIIAMSAHASENEVRLSREAGMNDYITKPFQPEEFLRKMVAFLQVISKDKVETVTLEEENSFSKQTEEYIDSEQDFQLVDIEFIRNFTKGKVERIEKMVTMFLDQTPTEINRLYDLYDTNNFSELGALIHSIKSKFTYMGLPHLSNLAFEIENNAKNLTHLDKIKAMIEELDAFCHKAYKELELLLVVSKS